MSEDTYLKDNIKKCVDYVMSKNDDDKKRIITGMFQYNDYLINEQLLVKALNDKEKQEWFNNDIFDSYKLEIERLNEDNEYLNKVNIELSTEKNRLNNIINKIKKAVKIAISEDNYDGGIYDIEDILGADKK